MTAMPTLIAEIGFTAGASTSTTLHLDDESRGLLGTGTLAVAGALTDVSADFRSLSCRRGSTRIEGPVVRYEAGTSTATLRNRERQYDPTNLSGPHVAAGISQVVPMRVVRYRAVWDGEVYDLFRGYADSWGLTYSKAGNYSEVALTATDGFKVLANHERVAGGAVGAGEDSGARVNRILDSVDWEQADRDVATGDTTLQATTLSGAALTELYLVSDTEIGELYIDAAGKVVFRNRNAILTDTRSNTSQATFSDQAPGLKYSDAVLTYDEEQLVNVARIARTGGSQQTVQDAMSIASYLTHTYERTDLLMETDTAALNHARFIVYHGKDPELRFSELVIDPQRDPENLYPQVLGREVGDRITIEMNPDTGDPIERDVFIRGIAHEITTSSWQTTWTLQSASRFAYFVIDNENLGVLGSNALAY